MGEGRGPWQDGRRAWERLSGWDQDGPSATPGHPDDGDGALSALADIGLVRRLLDQAELVAVRTARRHGKPWAEIATKLGVTRQSAWERWRDLDEAESPRPADSGSRREVRREVDAAAAADPAARRPDDIPAEVVERAARQPRRRSSVVVPNVIGLPWDDARQVLSAKRLVAVGPDLDDPPLAALGWPGGVVTDQSPESGARVPAGSPVTLWLRRGGGSAGVREPRRPKPAPKTAREMRSEPSDEAVG
jgi:hypothetical protein